MKEIDDLKKSVREHVEKLEKRGLYLEQIYLEYTREGHDYNPLEILKSDKREIIVKFSSKVDTIKPVWF